MIFGIALVLLYLVCVCDMIYFVRRIELFYVIITTFNDFFLPSFNFVGLSVKRTMTSIICSKNEIYFLPF